MALDFELSSKCYKEQSTFDKLSPMSKYIVYGLVAIILLVITCSTFFNQSKSQLIQCLTIKNNLRQLVSTNGTSDNRFQTINCLKSNFQLGSTISHLMSTFNEYPSRHSQFSESQLTPSFDQRLNEQLGIRGGHGAHEMAMISGFFNYLSLSREFQNSNRIPSCRHFIGYLLKRVAKIWSTLLIANALHRLVHELMSDSMVSYRFGVNGSCQRNSLLSMIFLSNFDSGLKNIVSKYRNYR